MACPASRRKQKSSGSADGRAGRRDPQTKGAVTMSTTETIGAQPGRELSSVALPGAEPGPLRRALAYALVRPTGSAGNKAVVTVGLVVGAALALATAAIHLDLWATGYRNIPTIGPLFLFQGIMAALLAAALLGWRRLITVVVAAGFLVATIGGLLLSVYVGLFGFMDSLAAPYAGASLVVEGAGAVVLGLVGSMLIAGHVHRSAPTAVPVSADTSMAGHVDPVRPRQTSGPDTPSRTHAREWETVENTAARPPKYPPAA